MELKISEAVFDHFLRSLTDPEFKIFMRLCRIAIDCPNNVAKVAQSELEYHCDLSHVTVSRALRHLTELKAIRKLPVEPLQTARRYEIVHGSKVNVVTPVSSPGQTPESVADLNLTPQEREKIMDDILDSQFFEWLGKTDLIKLKKELGVIAVGQHELRGYFSERVFPLLAIQDSEIVETYHQLKGEGQL